MHAAGQPAWAPFILPVVIVIVLALRLRGMRRVRRLRLETLAVVPAIYLVVFAITLWENPPVGLVNWLEIAAAAAVGGVLGWRRGKLMRITVDPVTHTLNQQSSPAALLFIVLLIVARSGLRYEGAAMGLNVLQVTDLLLAFGLGLFTATRVEMFLRARRLLEEARAV